MFLVGLTGGIGSGKTTVASILQELGVKIIDADKIAREVVEPGKPAWERIRKEFGDGILLANGMINRPVLAEIIFSNEERRKKLDQITHPEIYKYMLWRCIGYLLKGHQFVVLDLPLLYESNKMTNYMHKVIVVSCKNYQQVERLMKRNDLTESEARKRINAQIPLSEKCKKADYVIDNSGDYQSTKKQVEMIVKELRNSFAHWKLRLIFFIAAGLFFGTIGGVFYYIMHFIA